MFPYRKMLGPDVVLGYGFVMGGLFFQAISCVSWPPSFETEFHCQRGRYILGPEMDAARQTLLEIVFATSPVLGSYDFFNAMYIITPLPSGFML